MDVVIASLSDVRPHFGLGKAKQADIKIDWPSGIVQYLRNISANQILTVKEPTQ
jgi:hypothetical protein